MPLPVTPTVSVGEAGKLLGIGKSTAYAAVNNGTFPVPTIKIGGRIVVPTRPLLELLGLADDSPKVA